MPRTEGYLEAVKNLSSEFLSMSLIEFEGYFEKKVEPAKYMMVQVHVGTIKEDKILNQANNIRKKLNQKSLAVEINNELILVEANEFSSSQIKLVK